VRLGGRLAAALAAATVCTMLAACDSGPDLDGPPEKLSERDATALLEAREHLDDAIDTEETLRTSPEQARKLRRKAQAIVAEGAFETEELDEFGLAALGRLMLLVPSLVEVDDKRVPEALDRPATRDFLRYAERDADRALLRPAQEEVEAMERIVERSEAGPDTQIPPEEPPLTVSNYLGEIERNIERIWPGLAERLRSLGDEL
jgi:hypothetical protein